MQIRVDLAVAAPGTYLTRELGERPDNAERLDTWRDGVEVVERFRFEHGITDERRAFAGFSAREVREELWWVKEALDMNAPSIGRSLGR